MTTDQQGNMLIGDSKNDRIQVIGVLVCTVQEEMMVNVDMIQKLNLFKKMYSIGLFPSRQSCFICEMTLQSMHLCCIISKIPPVISK